MLAAGETIVLICGMPDLSIASILAFCGMIMALLLVNNVNFIVAIFITITSGVFIGYLNGIITTKFKVNPLITTLGTMAIFRGLAYIVTNGKSIGLNNKPFENLGRGSLIGIPIPFIVALIICLVLYFILNFTVFGRRIYAVGGSSDISELFGINVNRMKIMAFVISGITAAIGGVFLAAKMKTGSPIAGIGLELPVIAAVILGGTSISGGVGNIWGTILGVAFLSTLSNGFTLTYVSSYWQNVIRGIVLIGAVALDIMRREKRRK
ncbi:MAG: ABC transporter permease [Actinobacteria bacterium]|nr:ABC transporter permease [Actinomycetota bacterium]